MGAIKVGIIEDQQIIKDSLVTLLNARPNMTLGMVASTVEEYLDTAQSIPDDILLLDIGLPGGGMSGLEGIRPIKNKYPDLEIIMLTAFDDPPRVFKALCAGATAYLTKRTPFPKIAEAIETVHRGGSYMTPSIAKIVVQHFRPIQTPDAKLSPRQTQITDALLEGLSYKMIGDKLMISPNTVRDHIKALYKKLQINSRGELISMRVKGELD